MSPITAASTSAGRFVKDAFDLQGHYLYQIWQHDRSSWSILGMITLISLVKSKIRWKPSHVQQMQRQLHFSMNRKKEKRVGWTAPRELWYRWSVSLVHLLWMKLTTHGHYPEIVEVRA
jgi:hypothetical protein